jgi:hypothetical protein
VVALAPPRINQQRPVRSPKDRPTVFHLKPEPTPLVQHRAVAPAEQDEVAERGWALVRPVHDVVGVAPGGWAITPGEPAVLVSDDHGSPRGRRYQRSLSSHVEGLRRAGHHHPDDGGVTGKAPRHLNLHRTGMVELRRGFQVRKRIQTHSQRHTGSFSAHRGPVRSIQPLPGDLSQGVGPGLSGARRP